MRLFIIALLCACLVPASSALANTSHEGWPAIDGVLLMNKDDSARPLDGRPGQDPFGGQDQNYSCDSLHLRGACQDRFEAAGAGLVVSSHPGHNELLGGHGNDTLYAGPSGDVLWGDFKPSGQPTAQRDSIFGGAGRDFIYASHGYNAIAAGAGDDWIKAHYGSGTIDCGPGVDLLYISRKAQRGYRITGCETISHKTLGY
jgi:Ca2+-binding RTX toxin-like protein